MNVAQRMFGRVETCVGCFPRAVPIKPIEGYWEPTFAQADVA